MKKQNLPSCPCGGTGKTNHYSACCGRYINGDEPAPDAERLMRSRYTAYTMANAEYVLKTWHASTRPASLELSAPNTPHATKWLGLTVHEFTPQGPERAEVRFTARYRDGGRAYRMTEHSRFVREGEHWFYVDGEVGDDR